MMLQKILMETSKDIVGTIVKELSGTYRDIIRDEMEIIFVLLYLKYASKDKELYF